MLQLFYITSFSLIKEQQVKKINIHQMPVLYVRHSYIHESKKWKSLSCVHLFVTQPARLPYPSVSPGVCSNSCPLSRWCHSIVSSSVTPFSSCPQSFPALGSFPNESALCIRWPKYWSCNFSISPSSEYSGLISFRIDRFPCCPRDSQESSPAPQFKNIRSSITVS